ncbi:alpha-amylase [Bradyrhizobium sp. 4]|uniref:alpha-amylase family glycosyl hydrolase n=1 Tax=unclassified Bradyrhizobium TaxID=2631580 RepID=UPI001FFC11C3|nr:MULTISPECIES: alpha-amylase family glycosyl hydrolase [unclassified Bradyrhizobium]MCK1402706.1 alpha-amylase [Bradyrhizobium sp. 39]MCK1748301.1 alpha-amylase [Bradyrhizobium sp. 135]UPJ32779.1 alpha-amylase [Bradyrhizobium sp. 4]
MNLMPLGSLGAVESNGAVTFGLWMPWVSAADGNVVTVKIIHEADQFLQEMPAREFGLAHSVRAPYGDFWSVTVPVAGTPPAVPGSAWGSPGRYVYRYTITNPNVGTLDWIIDPFAREFGVGKQSAFTLGYQPYLWSAGEAQWRTPALADLILYEVNIAEFGNDLDRARGLVAYLADLGINAIEIMPLSNVGSSVDWGYLPIGYFGVDERFGKRSDFQQLVDICHQHGIAVIVDVVYGHTGVDFPYYDAYTRLRYRDNPFMGPFAKDYFSNFGKSTDFNRAITRDFFYTANHHWLEVYHVDGFRYDCVPNYWDGPMGVGYASLVYETHQLTKANIAAGRPYWSRFDGAAGRPLTLVQMAEQLEAPEDVLRSTYSNCTWQNGTYGAARAVAQGDRGRLADLGLQLGLFGYPDRETVNGDDIPKAALQYIENHDHERFLCNFGTSNPDEAGNPLFAEGDRARWYMLQPYLIGLLMSKGIPMLWQGEEFAENYFLPDFGKGRVSLLRPLRWDFFYDDSGRPIVSLVRKLLRIRRQRDHIRQGTYFFFNDWDRYQQFGVLLFARYDGGHYTLIAVNFGDTDRTVPFWFPMAGDYVEELHGGALDLRNVLSLKQVDLSIPSHYGRIWTLT